MNRWFGDELIVALDDRRTGAFVGRRGLGEPAKRRQRVTGPRRGPVATDCAEGSHSQRPLPLTLSPRLLPRCFQIAVEDPTVDDGGEVFVDDLDKSVRDVVVA